MSKWACLLTIVLVAPVAPASDAGAIAAAPEIGSERPSLLLPGTEDTRRGTFWFSPHAWTTQDLRHATLRFGFLVDGPLAELLLAPDSEPPSAPRAATTRLRAAPLRRGFAVEGAPRGLLGLFRPRVKVRVTPRLSVAPPPAPDKRPPVASAR